jgi:hypothetical protein
MNDDFKEELKDCYTEIERLRDEVERLSGANDQVWADNKRLVGLIAEWKDTGEDAQALILRLNEERHKLRAALGKPLGTPEGHKLKHDAGLPHLPTQLTYECRLAVGREGPRGYDWGDKPHRVVYDLCWEIETRAALAEEKPNE